MQAPDAPDPHPGAAHDPGRVLLGRFRVEGILGRGGMGEVLLAHDTLLQRRVALKHLRADGPQAADRRSALLKEARRASQVSDHRIAAIHDVLDLGDDVLLVMEHVEGVTLRERLREPFTLEEFWRLSRECVEALGAAHAKGVIHRDIKPENLMLTPEREIKILDFGIALRSDRHPGEAGPDDSTSSIGQSHRPAGTPRYMAPEAHYGGHIDERTDIFSLGAVFYEMLTARHPFEGGGWVTVLDHIMNSAPEPVSRVNPVVPDALDGVIERMLAREPARRYASCGEVAAALEAARSADPAQAAPPRGAGPTARGLAAPTPLSGAPAPPPPRRTLRVLATLGAVAAAVLLWRAFAGPPLPRDRHVALLLPETPGGSPEFTAFALGTVELLASRLQRHQLQPGFQMAPFHESLAEELTLVPDARKLLGANLALVATLEQRNNSLAARLELREPARGLLLGRRRFVVPHARPLAFADSLYRASVALLGLPARPRGVEPDLGVRGAGTLRFLAQGIGRTHAAASDEELARAREELENACRTEPDAAMPHAWLAEALIATYRQAKDPAWLARAEAAARRAVELDGERAEGHRVLAEALLTLKRPAEARDEFRRACELDPTRDDAWLGHGRSLFMLGDVDGERAVYAAAMQRRPHSFRPRWWLAQWEYRRGHAEAAIRAYQEMIHRAPDFSKGYASLGAMLVLQGEYGRAIDTLRLALALRPSSSAYSNLGTAYFNTGRLNECVDAYNQAFQFGEHLYLLWFNLGEAYYWLRGRSDQAREPYLQMVRLGRDEMLAKAESGDAPDPLITALLATVFPKLGHADSARIYLGHATALDSGNVRVQYHAALTHWQLGERARALDWLERAVEGGYPLAWLRDSPVHRDWRTEPRFTALLADAGRASRSDPSPETGGRR